MKVSLAAIALSFAVFTCSSPSATVPPKPQAGKVEIMKSSLLKPGMKGYAWTVFQGTEPEAQSEVGDPPQGPVDPELGGHEVGEAFGHVVHLGLAGDEAHQPQHEHAERHHRHQGVERQGCGQQEDVLRPEAADHPAEGVRQAFLDAVGEADRLPASATPTLELVARRAPPGS